MNRWELEDLGRSFCRSILFFSALGILGLSSSRVDARPGVTPFYNASASEISSPPVTLLRAKAIRLPTFFRAKAWRVLYATRDYRGLPIASSGMVILSAYSPKNPTSRQI